MALEFPEKLKPFRFHGVHFKFTGGQGIADCPFCGKEKHFYADPETGKWKCHVGGSDYCERGGNVYSFLVALHKQALDRTTEQDYETLSELRGGIPASIYEQAEIARDGKEWLVPIYNTSEKLVNLKVWGGPGSSFRSTEGLQLHLYGEEIFSPENDEALADPNTLFVLCEGEWDALALASISHLIKHPIVPLAVPGAGTLKPDWIKLLSKRRVALVYDNDEAGRKGIKLATEKLGNVAASLVRVEWPKGLKEGYDLNDFIAERKDDPKKAGEELLSLLVPAHTATNGTDSSPQKERVRVFKNRPSWNQVVAEYRKVLHTTVETEDALAVLFATILSNQIPRDPLWTFLVGPSGAGKTLVLLSLAQYPGCFFQSKLKPNLISGWRVSEGEDDPSLIAKMQGKTVVVEDFTQNLSMPANVQAELFSTLRGAYNGRAEQVFGNGVVRVYDNCKFSMVCGVTSVINSFSQSDMGERFIKVQFLQRDKHDEFNHIKAAMSSDPLKFQRNREHLSEVAHEFLEYVVDLKNLPKINSEYTHKIIRLAQVVTYLRGTVKRLAGRDGDVAYRGEREIGTRVAFQLQKLAVSLALVFGKKTIDERIYRIVENVALDTSQGYNLDITAQLINAYPKPLDVAQLMHRCRMSHSNVDRRLNDMIELDIVERKSEVKGQGRPKYGYRVKSELCQIWKKAGIRTGKIITRLNPKKLVKSS